MKIEFKRIERDSIANRNRRAAGETRGIVYDFDIFVDGVNRGTWHRQIYGVGYHLHDAGGDSINEPYARHPEHTHVVDARNQHVFERRFREQLEAGRIPTPGQVFNRTFGRVEDASAEVLLQIEIRAYRRKCGAGPELYDALKAAAHLAGRSPLRDRIEAALKLAEEGEPDEE